MKKIKLLTVLSSLSLLGVACMPLTSCGSNDSGSSDPVKPEGEKTKESTDGTSTFTLKFDKKPDDGKANVSITNSSSTNQVEIKTTSNVTSTSVIVGDDLKVNIQVGFVSLPLSECEAKFSLTFTYIVDGKTITVTINDLIIKYTPSTVKYTITFDKGDHGIIDKESITVSSGTMWSAIEKPTVTPDEGYSFSKWVDNDGKEIQNDYKITSNFQAKATYIDTRGIKHTITFNKGEHGTISQTSIEVTSGTFWYEIEKPIVTPDEGYNFSRWVDSDGNIIPDTYEVKSNFVATATYVTSEKYQINFDKGDHGESIRGSIVTDIEWGTLWSAIEKPTITIEGGYTFDKWVDSNGNEILDSYQVTSNFTAKATYKLNAFCTDTWENIINYANQGLDKLKEIYGLDSFIGAKREITINGQTHIVRVIGENHDERTDGTKAALTFQLITLLSDSTGNGLTTRWDFYENFDYTNSIFRKNLTGNGTPSSLVPESYIWETKAYEMLPTEVYSNIKTVRKTVSKSTDDGVSYQTTQYTDKLFPITLTEYGLGSPTSTSHWKIEGSKYEYFENHNDCDYKELKDAADNDLKYWMASPVITVKDKTNYAWLYLRGYPEENYQLYTEQAVTFGFCI